MDTISAQLHSLWQIYLALPIVTQCAVTLLFVSAVMVHLVAYNERTVHEGPSIFTTGGIFFTFVGIAEGLYYFDPEKLEASIPALLDGLKTAFIASVVGVGAALSIKLRYALIGVRRRHATPNDGATVDDLFEQMRAVQHALVGDDESTLISQLKLSRQDSNDRLDRLRQSHAEFMRTMAENNSKALIAALQEVIRDFNTKISEQFGDNFKQLNEAVGRLLNWQESYRLQLAESVEQQTKSAENMGAASEKYGALVSRAEEFSTIAERLSGLLSALNSQRSQIEESIKSLGTLLSTAASGLPQVERKIIELTEQVTYGTKQNQEAISASVKDTAVALLASVADFRSLQLEALQSANQQFTDHMKQLADKTNEQIVKLDVALETELSKSISSLGRQLTALSSRFVEDYGPLTEKLKGLVQAVRGA